MPANRTQAKRPPLPFAQMQVGDSFRITVAEFNELYKGRFRHNGVPDAERLRKRLMDIAKRYRDQFQADFAIQTRLLDDGVIGVWRVKYRSRRDNYVHLIEGGKQWRVA